MGIVVQKFGGTSVANTEKLFKVCNRIIAEKEKGNKVVVVVSAQGKTTDELIRQEKEIEEKASMREHDVLVSVGEQITIAKLSMCLEKLGHNAISLTGWQVPIFTNNIHGEALIDYIDIERIERELNNGNIVIVAGFQGIDENNDITTLGRGGSDTTGVALAVALKADKCDIYTDVDGVYTSDPNKVEATKRIKSISYDEMLELASAGAKVLHNRCVEIAKKYNVPVSVRSTFKPEDEGTKINNTKVALEGATVTGVTKQNSNSKIAVIGKNNQIGRLYKVFKLLANNNINIDMIAQAAGEDIIKSVSFSIQDKDLNKALEVLEANKEDLQIEQIKHYSNLAKVSIVGLGMMNNPGVAAGMFETLYDENIEIQMVSTSEIKVSVLVEEEKAEQAMRAIHKKFMGE